MKNLGSAKISWSCSNNAMSHLLSTRIRFASPPFTSRPSSDTVEAYDGNI